MYKVSFCFSSSPKELGKSTLAEAKFPLQKQAKPVDHHPYRLNPRAQEVIDKCVESMESDGDHPCVLSQKLTDHRVSVSITGIL